jgi:hypothetical protein
MLQKSFYKWTILRTAEMMMGKLVAIHKSELAESWKTEYHYFNFFTNTGNTFMITSQIKDNTTGRANSFTSSE